MRAMSFADLMGNSKGDGKSVIAGKAEQIAILRGCFKDHSASTPIQPGTLVKYKPNFGGLTQAGYKHVVHMFWQYLNGSNDIERALLEHYVQKHRLQTLPDCIIALCKPKTSSNENDMFQTSVEDSRTLVALTDAEIAEYMADVDDHVIEDSEG